MGSRGAAHRGRLLETQTNCSEEEHKAAWFLLVPAHVEAAAPAREGGEAVAGVVAAVAVAETGVVAAVAVAGLHPGVVAAVAAAAVVFAAGVAALIARVVAAVAALTAAEPRVVATVAVAEAGVVAAVAVSVARVVAAIADVAVSVAWVVAAVAAAAAEHLGQGSGQPGVARRHEAGAGVIAGVGAWVKASNEGARGFHYQGEDPKGLVLVECSY